MILATGIKVNFGLDILRKRPDGYHDIDTLFVPCRDYSDRLEIVPADEPSVLAFELLKKMAGRPAVQEISPDGKVMVTIHRPEGVDWNPLEDLTVRAYRLLDADFRLPSVKIVLEKGAPVGAGLGGGSADAAAALHACNRLFGLQLTDDQLAGYAARLGSDCAFFVYNLSPDTPRPMLGRGRGEWLTDFDPGDFFHRYRVKVYVPEGIHISTADAYRGITPQQPAVPLEERLRRPVETWRECLVNAFEPGILRQNPSLSSFKAQIYADGACYASLSGSGSAFFGLFPR